MRGICARNKLRPKISPDIVAMPSSTRTHTRLKRPQAHYLRLLETNSNVKSTSKKKVASMLHTIS
jgi:hypothetical protein